MATNAENQQPQFRPVRFFSINGGECLLIGTNPQPGDELLSRRWTMMGAKGGLHPGNSQAAKFFINGEPGAEEISANDAAMIAATIGGDLQAAIERV